jgi:hypothetical protein
MFTGIKRITAALLLLLGVLIFLSYPTQAQQEQIHIEKQIEILKAKLNLSTKQIKKVTVILEDQREEMITTTNNNRNDPQALNTMVQEITKKTENRIKEVLTEEQIKAYNKILKDYLGQADKQKKGNKK